MMKHEKLILAIDLGTSGPKVVLFDINSEVIDHSFSKTGYSLLPGGGAEQNPEEWWQAIKMAVSEVLSRNTEYINHIEAVSVTSQWSGTVAVDKKGHHLMNAIIWMDSRGAGEVKKITDGLIKVEGYGISKLYQWLSKTGGVPTSAGKDSIAHILFIKEYLPRIYEQAYKFLEPKDFINLKLTGRFVSSYDTMLLHWLTDNRKINDIKYSPKLLAISGIDREKLPDMVDASEVIENLS